MSKSKGNAVDPFEALETYGADAIRWYFYTNSAPWLPNRFHGKAVIEGQHKFMGTLWNTYAFYVLYANIDKFNPLNYKLEDAKLTVMDKWLLSRMNSMIKDVDNYLENYKIPEACKVLESFVDDMSNWYVRRGRERYWAQDMTDDKISAYLTLYTALVTTAKASAPMIPFMAEDIYRNLVCNIYNDAPESIHLCDFPVVDESLIDENLENQMEKVLEIVVLGRAARNGSSRKNRQPLNTMYVKLDGEVEDSYLDIIKDELNIKNVDFTGEVDNFVTYTFKPQLKTLGPKYGKQLGEIRTALAEIDGNAAKKQLDETGKLTLSISIGDIELETEDLLIDAAQKEGFFTLSDRGITVALDTVLTQDLIDEGYVRELVSKIQTMRKEADFNVTDHIEITITGSQKVCDIAVDKTADIVGDTLADSLTVTEPQGFVKEWDINDQKVTIGVKKV
jgi:isoleucyl-tRNA synthetase